MKWKKDNKYFKLGITSFCVVCASIVFYYIIFHSENLSKNISLILTVLSPIIYGIVIAYLVTPILNFIQYKLLSPLADRIKWKSSNKREKILRYISVFITLMFVLGVIVALISLIIGEIVPSIKNIMNNSDTYFQNATIWVNNVLEDNPTYRDYAMKALEKYSNELEGVINSTLLEKGTELIKTVSLSVFSVFKVFWNFILGFIISIYLLAGKERFTGEAKRCIYAMLKENTANIVLNNFKFAHKTFSGFISGKVIDSIIIGILCFIGTAILGTPYAALVSLIIGITNVIPFFGPFIGAIPSCILILLVDPLHPLNVIYFGIFILVLQQLDGNLIGPKILGESTGLTGFWVIFAITVFGGLFGIIGILAGVPIFAVIYAAAKAFIETKLAKKKLKVESEAYTNINGVIDGEYSHCVPEYTLTKKKSKILKQENEKQNLLKHYGDNYLCEFDREQLVKNKNELQDENQQVVQDQVTSSEQTITKK